MSCPPHGANLLAEFTISVLFGGGILLVTIISMAFLIINTRIDTSLHHILISFQTSNIVGVSIVIYDLTSLSCRYENHVHVVSISVCLSISHMILLLVAEHALLTSSVNRPVESFSGLICVSWIISIALGVITTITTSERQAVSYLAFAVCAVIVISIVLGTYALLIRRKHWIRKRLIFFRKKQVLRKHRKDQSYKRYWKLKYDMLIFISYVVCTLPWIVENVVAGAGRGGYNQAISPDTQFAVLVVYACNFFFPSAVFVYIWRKHRGRRRVHPLQQQQFSSVEESGPSGSIMKPN